MCGTCHILVSLFKSSTPLITITVATEWGLYQLNYLGFNALRGSVVLLALRG